MEEKRFKWFNEASEAFMRNNEAYLKNDETIQDRVESIAKRAFVDIYPNPDYYDKFIDYMSKGFISLSTPVWSNFGREGTLAIACFNSHVPDTMDGIMYTAAEAGMMSKYGGGTSAYVGEIRPRGSVISKGGTADGPVHFAKLFETIVDVAKQGKNRRGSMTITLPVEHPDIKEFLDIRHEGSPIQDLFPSVSITNQWMQEMIDGNTEKRNLWADIIRSRQRVGTPFVFFKDNANDVKQDIYKHLNRDINSSNLCVAPYTKILTSNGHVEIGDLENEEVEIWNGEEFSKVKVIKTGENQELVRVKTNSGYELDCTPYHKFYVQKGYRSGTGLNKLEIIEKRAHELQPGDKLIKFDLPIIEGVLELKHAYGNGFYSGDGCLTPQGNRIYLYGDKKNLKHKFDFIDKWTVQDSLDRIYGHSKELKDKFFVPDAEYSVKSRLEWLAGYADADGVVTNNNGSQAIQIGSVNKDFLRDVQLMLQTLGCDSKVTFGIEGGKRLLPKNDGTGELGYYDCKDSYRLLINGNSLYKLLQLGFKCERLQWTEHLPNRECSRFITIQSVEKLDYTSDTYCFNEPKRNLGMFNGMLTGQCQEIMLSSTEDESFVCCLSSLNVEKYDEWKDTDVVEVMTAFLDTVITDFVETASKIPFLERAVKFSKNQRALGLGVLGFASYLQKMNIPFESMEAKLANVEIFSTMQKRSYAESERLGKLLGYAPIYDAEGYEGVKRRNVTTMAIAPTSSSSFILSQTSQGIEPYRSNYYMRNMAKGKIPFKNPHLEKLLKEKGRDTEEVWDNIGMNFGSVQHLDFLSDHEKEVFKTFGEISQMEIVNLAAQRQRYIDQGQSLNFLLHPKTPPKELNELMIHAWKTGIKSLYYHHSISSIQEYTNTISCKSCES